MKVYMVTLTKELTVYVRAASPEDASAHAEREEHQMFSDCYADKATVWADSRPVTTASRLVDWDANALIYGDHAVDITTGDAIRESAEEVEREKTAPLPFKEPRP